MDAGQFESCRLNRAGFRDYLEARKAGGQLPPPVESSAGAPAEPGLWRKAANFTAAALKQAPLFAEALWTGDEAAAFRSAEEIERIAAICAACPLFNGEVCTHKHCGCAISADRSAWLSKLAWRSQRCPDDPPRWGAGEIPTPEVEGPKSKIQNPPVATTRHLLYHVYAPPGSDVWRKNVRQLVRRIELFNGRRCVAIATGPGLVSPAEVRAAFREGRAPSPAEREIEFLEIPNSPCLRERATFEALMERVASTEPGGATFYAHAKGGATIGDATGVMFWRNLMYRALLDDFERVRAALAGAPIVGTHRLGFRVVYPDALASSDWHFSGAFFWFRNADVFGRDWRSALAPSGWGVEAWPGRLFPISQSRCLTMEDPVNPYDPTTYAEGDRVADDDGPGASIALKLEIGGGAKPRGEGYLNVDKCATADVRIDFDAAEFRLPFDDDSVLGVCSSHCLEHVLQLRRLLREIVRVCRVGAMIELRLPHWNSSMAMCHDHVQTIAEPQIEHWCESAVEYWLGAGNPKRLRLTATDYVAGGSFAEAKQLFPHLSDTQIMRFIPDACHEIQFVLHVVAAEPLAEGQPGNR